MKQLTLLGFHLSTDGLTASYRYVEELNTFFFSPFQTCTLFKEAGLIEGFEEDEQTGDPVILYSDSSNSQGYNGCFWSDFVRSFPLTEQICFALIQYKVDRGESKAVQNLINSLLSPLAA